MDCRGVNVGRVSGLEVLDGGTVADAELAFEDVEELATVVLVLVGAGFAAAVGEEFGEVGIELAVGDEVAEAFEEVHGLSTPDWGRRRRSLARWTRKMVSGSDSKK